MESRDGVWWLVDPAGEKFFSLGVNVIAPGPDQASYDADRPEYAAWRYYASTAAWADAATARLHEWKFNTVGGWPHRLLTRGALPYAEVLHLGAEAGVPWNDLFSESFADQMDRIAAERVTARRDDKQVLGWFTDNELAWYPDMLLTYHSEQPATSATRQQLIALLRLEYHDDFTALQRDFIIDAGIDDFEQLAQGGALKLKPGGKSQTVVSKFAELLAQRYYDVVCAAVRKHDSHHLVLGDRYHGYVPDAVAKAAATRVDVISTNYDWPRGTDGYLPRFYLRRLHALSGKPVLITEYYSAAKENRSGNPNSGGLFVVVDDQRTRADVVRTRLAWFADEPYVVGAHWFSYADEPPHGRRGDGEDYNFGLVDIHNEPYQELIETMGQMHVDAPKRHAAAEARNAVDPTEIIQVDVARLRGPTDLAQVEVTLLEQTELTPLEDAGIADLIASWDGQRLYLTLAGNHCVMAAAYAGSPQPASEGLTWTASAAQNDQGAEFKLDMLGQKAERLHGRSEFAHWQRGVRFGATLAITAKDLGRESFMPGETVRVVASLRDNRDGRQTRWSADLTCVDSPGNVYPTAARVTQAQVTLDGTDRTDR